MSSRDRLSATVERHLLQAGRRAVAEGRAESLSGWVNEALRLQCERDRRLKAMDDFMRSYEAAHGEITEEEMREAKRQMRARAITVRGRPTPRRRPAKRTA